MQICVSTFCCGLCVAPASDIFGVVHCLPRLQGQGRILFTNISHMLLPSSYTSSNLSSAPSLCDWSAGPKMWLSGAAPGVLWRRLKEKSVATVSIHSMLTEERNKHGERGINSRKCRVVDFFFKIQKHHNKLIDFSLCQKTQFSISN